MTTPERALLTALAAAALAGAAALLVWREKPAEPSRPLAGLGPGDLARVEIDAGGAHVALEKAAGRWRLTAPIADDADAGAAEALGQGLRELTLGSEVSRDPGGYADYELEESSATRVRVYSRSSAAPLLDGYFGKPALGSSVYFRPSREAAVLLADGVPSGLLRADADSWRSKALLPMSLGELDTLRAGRKGGLVVSKSSGAWTAAGGRLSADRAAQLALAASSLRFTSFAPAGTPAARTGLAKPAAELAASGGGRSERVLLGREEAGQRYALAEGRKALGLVSKRDADALLELLQP